MTALCILADLICGIAPPARSFFWQKTLGVSWSPKSWIVIFHHFWPFFSENALCIELDMGHTSKWQICMQFQQWRNRFLNFFLTKMGVRFVFFSCTPKTEVLSLMIVSIVVSLHAVVLLFWYKKCLNREYCLRMSILGSHSNLQPAPKVGFRVFRVLKWVPYTKLYQNLVSPKVEDSDRIWFLF